MLFTVANKQTETTNKSTDLQSGVCRRAKLSHLQHIIHKARIPVSDYASGPVKNTLDYIVVRQEDKVKVRNVKVIPNEECVPKHKLLVMDMHKKFEPRVHVWKLKKEKT